MCMFCKNDSYRTGTTTHVVNYKSSIIIVKNVPCLVCDQCGETYLTDGVAEKVESIVESIKKIVQEITVVDYQMTA